jgi:hypothetical protein
MLQVDYIGADGDEGSFAIYSLSPTLSQSMGIYTSGYPFSFEGESWDEMRGYNQLILFSSPQPSPAGEGVWRCCNRLFLLCIKVV